MPAVESVVFDVGRVLVDFDYTKFFAFLRQNGAALSDEADFVRKVDLVSYEEGVFDSDEFLKRLNSLLEQPLPEIELISQWNNIFTPLVPMLEFAESLKVSCNVYLLSNTGPIHWKYLQNAFKLDRICHDLLASFEAKSMKPAPAIFQQAEKRFGLIPATTVFLDDRQDNVDGALACGWQAFQHRGYTETRQRLVDLTGCDV